MTPPNRSSSNPFSPFGRSAVGLCHQAVETDVPQISAQELQQCLDENPENLILVDVRLPWEYAIEHFPEAVLIPFAEFHQGTGIAKVKAVLADWHTRHADQARCCHLIVYCTAGIRSAEVLQLLQQASIEGRNLDGGIRAWHRDIQRPIPYQQAQSRKDVMNRVESQQTSLLKLGWLPIGITAAVVGAGLAAWVGYKVVHNPDRLRPLMQAGVPLHLLANVPALGGAIQAAELPQITVQELKQRIDTRATDYVLVDVRSPQEYKDARIPGAISVPLTDIESGAGIEEIRSLLQGRQLIAYCTSGYRSGKALVTLRHAGIEGTQVKGGIVAWHEQISP